VSSYIVVVSHPSVCICGGDERMTVTVPDKGIEARISCPHCTASQPLYDLLENL
jgi:hypothetical protein